MTRGTAARPGTVCGGRAGVRSPAEFGRGGVAGTAWARSEQASAEVERARQVSGRAEERGAAAERERGEAVADARRCAAERDAAVTRTEERTDELRRARDDADTMRIDMAGARADADQAGRRADAAVAELEAARSRIGELTDERDVRNREVDRLRSSALRGAGDGPPEQPGPG